MHLNWPGGTLRQYGYGAGDPRAITRIVVAGAARRPRIAVNGAARRRPCFTCAVNAHAVHSTIAALAATLAACAVCSCAASATSAGQEPASTGPAAGPGSASPASPASSAGPASAAPASAAGATAPVSTASFWTPLQATLSWFAAVNAKDKAAAVAHFVPADAGMMNWGNGDTSTWSTFTRLRCKPLSQDTASATVYCSFDESQSPSEGNPDTFWTVTLTRQPDGRWLIDNYGQG